MEGQFQETYLVSALPCLCLGSEGTWPGPSLLAWPPSKRWMVQSSPWKNLLMEHSDAGLGANAPAYTC